MCWERISRVSALPANGSDLIKGEHMTTNRAHVQNPYLLCVRTDRRLTFSSDCSTFVSGLVNCYMAFLLFFFFFFFFFFAFECLLPPFCFVWLAWPLRGQLSLYYVSLKTNSTGKLYRQQPVFIWGHEIQEKPNKCTFSNVFYEDDDEYDGDDSKMLMAFKLYKSYRINTVKLVSR